MSAAAKTAPTLYYDRSTGYLELHALRAPVGDYRPEFQENDAYDLAVSDAIRDFEADNLVNLFCLGRSGRHICIEDTPANRKRYAVLQRRAIAAAKGLWASMRTKGSK